MPRGRSGNRFVEFIQAQGLPAVLRDPGPRFFYSKYSTHLVYLTSANFPEEIESKVVYSILQRQPKRADIYWFVHVDVLDRAVHDGL